MLLLTIYPVVYEITHRVDANMEISLPYRVLPVQGHGSFTPDARPGIQTWTSARFVTYFEHIIHPLRLKPQLFNALKRLNFNEDIYLFDGR